MLLKAISKIYSTFLSLLDTPSSYSGQGGKFVKVNTGETGLAFSYHSEVNVMDYGAVGDGATDDTSAYTNAIAALPANGGVVLIPVTTSGYKITSTITPTKPVIFKGIGGISVNPGSKTIKGAKILWYGGASPVFMVDGSSSIYLNTGVRFENLGIDCRNLATYGITSDRWMWGGCKNVDIVNPVTACLRLDTQTLTANHNTMWNTFKDMYLGGPRGIEMDAVATGGVANVCHNKFENIQIDYTGDYGIYMYDTDNNNFQLLWIFRRSGAGKGVYLGERSRANYFYHIQPSDGGIEVNCTLPAPNDVNTIMDYDRENGQPAPTITAGKLIWTEGSGNGGGWRFPLYNYTTAGLPAASSVKSGTQVYVSDGSPKIQYSDGTNWIGVGSALTVKEIDGSPSYTSITTLQVPNASLTQPSAGIARLNLDLASFGIDGGAYSDTYISTANVDAGAY